MSHENFITFNCDYVYIKYFKHHFDFCVSKSFYYSVDNALLQKIFTDILNCCYIHLTCILLHMANLFNGFITTNHIADIYNKFIKVTSKLHKTSSSIGFIKKALHHNVTPTFAEIRGQFVNNKDQIDA